MKLFLATSMQLFKTYSTPIIKLLTLYVADTIYVYDGFSFQALVSKSHRDFRKKVSLLANQLEARSRLKLIRLPGMTAKQGL